MKKIKTKKSASKRFRFRGSGKLKRGQAFKRHILTKKSKKTKRKLRLVKSISKSDLKSVKNMMPYK